MIRSRMAALIVAACIGAGAPAASAASVASVVAPSAAVRYAPLDRPGPALDVPVASLAAALTCSGDFTATALEPVLLSPATGVTPDQNYSWNYERAFTAQGRPWCAVTMPLHTEGDIQVAGEYLVSAIRAEYALAGRRIAILGHSQGGMSMRWALRFWPDTRLLVDDVIGMAGTNHGSTAGWGCSATLRCPPAGWQQQATSQFIAALNSGAETFAGISYTEIFTHTDEVVQPNNTDADASSAVHTGAGLITNVATQDVCRLDVDEHFTIGTIDPAAYALVMDALTHPGPADPSRVNRAVCRQVFAPDVDPTQAKTALIVLAALGGIGAGDVPNATLLGIPKLPVEPSLRCYVFAAGC